MKPKRIFRPDPLRNEAKAPSRRDNRRASVVERLKQRFQGESRDHCLARLAYTLALFIAFLVTGCATAPLPDILTGPKLSLPDGTMAAVRPAATMPKAKALPVDYTPTFLSLVTGRTNGGQAVLTVDANGSVILTNLFGAKGNGKALSSFPSVDGVPLPFLTATVPSSTNYLRPHLQMFWGFFQGKRYTLTQVTSLVAGHSYQVQISYDMVHWKNVGPPVLWSYTDPDSYWNFTTDVPPGWMWVEEHRLQVN